MKIVIDYKNDCYRMKKTGINNKIGISVKKRTNSYDKIYEYVQSLDIPQRMLVTDNVKLYYENGDCLILKDYKKMLKQEQNTEDNIYHYVLDYKKINNVPYKETVLYLNKRRMAALALATVTLVGAMSISPKQKDDILQKTTIDITNELDYEELTENNFEVTIPETSISVTETTENDSLNISEQDFDLAKRIEQSCDIYNGNVKNNSIIPICTKLNSYSMNKIVNFLNSSEGQYFFEYGEQYGVDPYLLVAIAMAESSLNHKDTIPGGSWYNGFGVGIMQIETPDKGGSVTAFNYLTNELETIEINMEKAIDLETNIKIGAAIAQERLHKYNNNIYLTLQSYNYGSYGMDLIINKYAEQTGKSYEEVVNNITDVGWLKYVEDFHNNPKNYLKNWKYKTYGNYKYISDVLEYYIGVISKNMMQNGTVCFANLQTMQHVYEEVNTKTY